MRKMRAVALALAMALGAVGVRADALVSGDLNLRASPSAKAAKLGVLPQGARVAVFGCLPAGWCDVALGPMRGWASGRYLRPIVPMTVYLNANPGYVAPAPTWFQPQPGYSVANARLVMMPAQGWGSAPMMGYGYGYGYRTALAPGWGGGWYLTR